MIRRQSKICLIEDLFVLFQNDIHFWIWLRDTEYFINLGEKVDTIDFEYFQGKIFEEFIVEKGAWQAACISLSRFLAWIAFE